jgi:uncharacterized membrane protein YsdA (DUF1294 family)
MAAMFSTMLIYFFVISLLTFLIYAFDKAAARKRHRRISERTLHLLSLVGGWIGALLAQQLLRHKTVKQPFKRIFWCTVALNISFVAVVVYGIVRYQAG